MSGDGRSDSLERPSSSFTPTSTEIRNRTSRGGKLGLLGHSTTALFGLSLALSQGAELPLIGDDHRTVRIVIGIAILALQLGGLWEAWRSGVFIADGICTVRHGLTRSETGPAEGVRLVLEPSWRMGHVLAVEFADGRRAHPRIVVPDVREPIERGWIAAEAN